MKAAFFEIEEWETLFIKERLGPLLEASFSKEKLSNDLSFAPTEVDAISVFVGSRVDKDTLSLFPNLKLITTRSTGVDHMDVAAARERGIAVGYVPGYGDNTVAEFAFGLILALSRKIYESFERIRATGSFSPEGLRGRDLQGKTIGVIGTGRIGRHLIRIARGFEMSIVAHDAFPSEELPKALGFRYVSLDELLAESDVISIHVPYNELTHHLIHSGNISKIKRGALLINTARGAIVETEALVRALKEGILGGAGLDVLEEEGALQDEESLLLSGKSNEHNLKTVLANHVLIDMPNVIITPHNAFNTAEALTRILLADIENIDSFSRTGMPKFSVPV